MKFPEAGKTGLKNGLSDVVTVYRIDDLEVDTTSRRVRRAGARLDVAGLSFDVLKALIEAQGEPLSTDELAAKAWGQSFVSDETIAKRIALLREALGDEARAPRYVRTVRGKGYALATPPVVLNEVVASGDAQRSWLLPAGFGLSVATIFVFIFAALLRADYSVTMVDGATGHVDHTIERAWAGAAPIDLVDPVTGDVLLQTQTTPEVRAQHAQYMLELAETRYATGDREAAQIYARAAVALNRELSPSLERFGEP